MIKKGACIIMGLLVYAASYGYQDFTAESAKMVQKRFYTIRRLEDPIETFKKIYQHVTIHAKRGPMQLLDERVPELLQHPVVKTTAHEIITTKTIEPFHKLWTDFLSYKCIDDVLYSREIITLILLLYKNMFMIMRSQSLDSSSVAKKETPFFSNNYTELIELLSSGHHLALDFCADIDCDAHDNISALTALYDDEQVNSSDFLIHNSMRFYHIQRLLYAMFILSKHKDRILVQDNLDCEFKHQRLKECIQEIKKTGTVIPLLKVWKNFVAYDFIDDQLFVQDFIRLMIIVYAHVLRTSAHKSLPIPPAPAEMASFSSMEATELYNQISELPITELLAMLDEIADQFAIMSQEYQLTNQHLSWKEWFKSYWWTPPVIIGSIFMTMARYAATLQKIVTVLSAKKATDS